MLRFVLLLALFVATAEPARAGSLDAILGIALADGTSADTSVKTGVNTSLETNIGTSAETSLDTSVVVATLVALRLRAQTTTLASTLASTQEPDPFLGLEPAAPPDPDTPPPRLRLPAQGTIARAFGEADAQGRLARGISLITAPEAPVFAPASGRVVFAQPFPGYGRVLILRLDGGYHGLVAGLGKVRSGLVGAKVAVGAPLGRAPSTPAPRLYLELRRGATPINPRPVDPPPP